MGGGCGGKTWRVEARTGGMQRGRVGGPAKGGRRGWCGWGVVGGLRSKRSYKPKWKERSRTRQTQQRQGRNVVSEEVNKDSSPWP